MGVEPTSSAWKAEVLAIELRPQESAEAVADNQRSGYRPGLWGNLARALMTDVWSWLACRPEPPYLSMSGFPRRSIPGLSRQEQA